MHPGIPSGGVDEGRARHLRHPEAIGDVYCVHCAHGRRMRRRARPRVRLRGCLVLYPIFLRTRHRKLGGCEILIGGDWLLTCAHAHSLKFYRCHAANGRGLSTRLRANGSPKIEFPRRRIKVHVTGIHAGSPAYRIADTAVVRRFNFQ